MNPMLKAIDQEHDPACSVDANYQHLRHMFEGYRAHVVDQEEADCPYSPGSAREHSWSLGIKLAKADDPKGATQKEDALFVLWYQNHTTGTGGYGPAARSPAPLREFLFNMADVEWSDRYAGFADDPPEEQKTWDWYAGLTKGGGPTYTAFIRPLKILEEDTTRRMPDVREEH